MNAEWWKRAYGTQSVTYGEETLRSQIALQGTTFYYGAPTPSDADDTPDVFFDTGFGIMQSTHQELKILPDHNHQKLPLTDWASSFLAANRNLQNGVWK